MGRTAALGIAITVVLVGVAVGGVWWQRARTAARARALVMSAAEVELLREPAERSGLVQADRDLAALAASDPDPDLLRARARIALMLRLPEDALSRLDEVGFAGRSGLPDLALRAQALALRHALGGRIDDARQATAQASEHFEATGSVASALLAWQCATRIDDHVASDAIAERLAQVAPDSWESRVVQALRAFDPEDLSAGASLRRLQLEGPALPELDMAVATLDIAEADPTARARGAEVIAGVIGVVPSSKPARLVAVLACDRVGDVVGRNAHLHWLIANYPEDERAAKWRELSARR